MDFPPNVIIVDILMIQTFSLSRTSSNKKNIKKNEKLLTTYWRIVFKQVKKKLM